MSIGLTRLLQLECRLSVESEYRGSDSARERERGREDDVGEI